MSIGKLSVSTTTSSHTRSFHSEMSDFIDCYSIKEDELQPGEIPSRESSRRDTRDTIRLSEAFEDRIYCYDTARKPPDSGTARRPIDSGVPSEETQSRWSRADNRRSIWSEGLGDRIYCEPEFLASDDAMMRSCFQWQQRCISKYRISF